MVLFDGTRLIRQDRWDALLADGLSAEELHSRSVFPVHPSFRVIAIGQEPSGKAGGVPWLTAEVATYFRFHEVPAPRPACALWMCAFVGSEDLRFYIVCKLEIVRCKAHDT